MERISPKDVQEAAGISPSYASMILNKARTPPRSLAIFLFRKLGWKHPSIEALTDEQIATLEAVEPWVSPKDREPSTERMAS